MPCCDFRCPGKDEAVNNGTCQLEKTEKLAQEGNHMGATGSPDGSPRLILRGIARTATLTEFLR